jgi:hypothetical protein
VPEARVIFAVAAERDDVLIWERLRGLGDELFAAGPIAIKVGYFGREVVPPCRPFVSTRWATDVSDLHSLVDHARAHCVCGCFVSTGDILAMAAREAKQGPLQAVVIIGDHFWGNRDEALAHAEQLRAAGTRLFLFRQRLQGTRLDDVFETLAQITNGVYYEFNPAIERVAERLPRFFEAVAHYAIADHSSGPDALREVRALVASTASGGG